MTGFRASAAFLACLYLFSFPMPACWNEVEIRVSKSFFFNLFPAFPFCLLSHATKLSSKILMSILPLCLDMFVYALFLLFIPVCFVFWEAKLSAFAIETHLSYHQKPTANNISKKLTCIHVYQFSLFLTKTWAPPTCHALLISQNVRVEKFIRTRLHPSKLLLTLQSPTISQQKSLMSAVFPFIFSNF